MKRRDIISLSMGMLGYALTYPASFYGGRDLILPLLLPPSFLPGLVTVVSLFFFVSFGLSWPLRTVFVAIRLSTACLVVGMLFYPSGYFEKGRRAHVRAVISLEVSALLCKTVSVHPEFKTTDALVSLTMDDLPESVSRSAWGSPSTSYFRYDSKTKTTEITLTWGSGLINYHGIIITDPPGSDPLEENLDSWDIEALYPGAFIFTAKTHPLNHDAARTRHRTPLE